MKRRIREHEEEFVFPIYVILASYLSSSIGMVFREMNILVSAGAWGMVVAMFLEIINISQTAKERKMQYFFYLATIFMFTVFSFLRMGLLRYDLIVSFFSFLELPVILFGFTKIKSANLNKCIYICFFITSVIYIYLAHSPSAHLMIMSSGEYHTTELTLGFNNPNVTGVYLFVAAAGLMCCIREIKTRFLKAVLMVDVIYIIYLIWQTRSRAAIIIMFLYVGLFLFDNKIKQKWIMNKIYFIIPVVYAPISIIFRNKLREVLLLGESFDTGRIRLYEKLLNNLDLTEFFFGNFKYIFGNLHNAPLSIFATVGVICAIVYYIFIYKVIRRASLSNQTPVSRTAIAAIVLIVLHSSVEAMVFASGSTAASFVIMFYTLCINNSGAKQSKYGGANTDGES